ncbi:AfsR/SARP family transcriptional regulator [Saccharopolyspora sp. CA-218241]|uniref:AfsR/SARP family transcriptional regulator n=1 Tax=Saccharopolyspora sp. CA-218241 TaxID=3240027 RepID=UPI003D97C279
MIRFRLLGPVQVRGAESGFAPVPGVRRRALLAMLLLNAGRTTPVEVLEEQLWPFGRPASGANALQAHVTRLRRDLRARGGEAPHIVHADLGYLLEVPAGELDLSTFNGFRQAAGEASGQRPLEAANLLRRALALWRGPALADVREHSPRLRLAAARMEEHRLLALEDLVELDLRLERHDRIIGDLTSLAAAHPLRERLHCQLITALGRAGRRTEAADVFRRMRRRVLDELGVEPSAALNDALRGALSGRPRP